MQSTKELLAISSEAAVLIRGGRILFANRSALELLDPDCVGKSTAEVFGETVAGVQAPSFLAQVRLKDQPCLLRFVPAEGEQICFLRPQKKDPALLNQPFFYALRSSIMNMELAADRLREAAEDRTDAAELELLRSLTRAQFRIRRLVQNASIISGEAEGSLLCSLRRFDLALLCRTVLDGVQRAFPDIRFRSRLEGEAVICADPELIKCLLLNLLSNVILHARDCTCVSLSLLSSPGSLVLALDDDGCGIPPDRLYQVFDRYRHEFDLCQMGAGPGLGLTAARIIAQLHGGTLLLESRPGQGTTLRVSLAREALQLGQLSADSSLSICQSRDLLTGLADCLPEEYFSERWLD